MTTIKQALKQLNASNPKHWAENGAPSLNAVQVIMKDSSVTQADLDAAAGDMRRPESAIGKKPKTVSEKREGASEKELDALLDPETGQFDLMEDVEIKDKATGETIVVQRRKRVFVKNMLVAAVERGFANGSIRDPGDTFMYTGELGTWMMPGDHARVEEIRNEYAKTRAEALNPAPVPVGPDAA